MIRLLIENVSKFDNDELRSLLKEISPENKNKNLSAKSDMLFKLYDNENWRIGLDRFSEIRRCIEVTILKRIENDLF